MDDFVLNISTTAPEKISKKPPKHSQPKKQVMKDVIEVPPKSAKPNSKPAHKSSSLFTKLPEVVIPNNLTIDKTDYSITNAPTADSFSSMHLDEFILGSLQTHQITNPTDIQRIVIPQLLQKSSRDRDIIIQAQTGSGKTLSYVLPIMQDLLSTGYHDRQIGTLALIIVPTRELCQQVYDTFYSLLYPKSVNKASEDKSDDDDDDEEATPKDSKKESAAQKKNCKYRWIVPGIVCGGQSKKSEKARLRKGVTILIATPGRLLDHLRSTQCMNLKLLRWLVMDEADRFEEMGMKDSMIELQSELERLANGAHRTVLCSATVNEKVLQLGGTSLKNPLYLSSKILKEDDDKLEVVPNQIRTTFYTVPAKLRLVTLAGLLRIITEKDATSKTIVFFSNCATVEYYHKLLSSKFNVTKLHGSIPHEKRVETLKGFKSGILLTTDLAARGLDFPGVKDIIQFDIPNDSMACMHRIGRTARCGSDGNACIFVMPHEVGWIEHMKELIEGNVQSYQPILDELQKILKVRDIRVELANWQKDFEELALKDMKQAKEAFMTSVKAYATHPKEVRQVLGVKSLHLGHYAKSFALREAPSNLMTKTVKKRIRKKEQNQQQQAKKFKLEVANEFAA